MGKRGELRGMGRTLFWTICLLLCLNSIQAERAPWECADDITDEDNCMECDRVRDSLALVALYNSTDGPNWTNTWDLNEPIDTWYGITINGEGCVECIDLDGDESCTFFSGTLGANGNNLVGEIPIEIGEIKNLKRLILARNLISGEIPQSLYDLNNIEVLDLGDNRFTGGISESLGNLTKIKRLSVRGNFGLGGRIPMAIGNLINLTNLNLSTTNINGTIPSEIGNLINLESLLLGYNKMNGEIPMSIGNLIKLKTLAFSNAQHTGELPISILNLTNLEILWGFNNQLTGTIPQLSAALPSLKKIYLNNNNFSGCINDLLIDCTLKQSDDVNSEGYDLRNNPLLPWQGDFARFCAGEDQIGAPCDDGDPDTADDKINADCECRGEVRGCSREADSLELVKFYNNFRDNGPWKYEWDFNKPLDSLWGVELNADGCVVRIDLDGNPKRGFAGPFDVNTSGQLYQMVFPELNDLRLIGVYGKLLDFTGMPKLIELSITRGEVEGPIIDFSNMQFLRTLGLGENNLTGKIPDFENLSELSILSLGDNDLFGEIPKFENLKSLSIFSICGNSFDQPFAEFNKIGRLSWLNISNNNFRLPLPTFIDNPNIRILFMDGISDIKEFPLFVSLQNLNRLSISNCNINSDVPFFVDFYPNLRALNIAENQLTFENIIGSFESNIQLIQTNATSNGSYGDGCGNLMRDSTLIYSPQDSIFIDTLMNVTSGDQIIIDLLIDEGLESNVYQWYKDDMPYTIIEGNNNLEFNNIRPSDSGVYRAEVTNPFIPDLTLYSRDITINVEPTCRERDSLGLVTLYNSTDGPNWTNSWNLSEPMDTWWGVYLNENNCVNSVSLASNNLNGVLPSVIGALLQCEQLSLQGNGINGMLPKELFQLSFLNYLDLSGNRLSGSIPQEIGDLKNLRILNLHINDLVGEIPNSIGSLEKLTSLSLDNNNLDGYIPSGIGSLSVLRGLNLHSNNLTGPLPIELGNLDSLEYMNIHRNQINGELPNEIFELKNLRILNLSYNELVGSIPEGISGLSNIEGLDLQFNRLNGEIPNSIRILNSLTFLALNDNNLSGCFPSGIKDLCYLTNELIRPICGVSSILFRCQYNLEGNPLLPWQGDFARFCAGEDQIGAPCDDGDPSTSEDKINEDCECRGCGIIAASINGPISICEGQREYLSVSDGPYESYRWSTGANDPEIEVSQPGLYTAEIMDTNGCMIFLEYTLEQSNTEGIIINGPDILCDAQPTTLSIDGFYESYDWGDYGNDPTADVLGPGTYKVELIDENGCQYNGAIFIGFDDDCPDNSKIEKAITPNGDGINDAFHVGIDNLAADYIRNELLVFNRWGGVVYEAQPYNNDWSGQNLSGQDLPEGTYYVLFKLNDNNNFQFRGSVTVVR